MIEERLTVSQSQIAIRCDDRLSAQAKWLGEMIVRVHERGVELRDGVRLQIGWSVVTLRDVTETLLVQEPNFDGDPFTELRDEVTTTLDVIAAQNDFLRLVGAEGQPVRFDQKVVISAGALAREQVYLERGEVTSTDSGWYIGPVEEAEEELQAMYVYQLLQTRPEFMQVLILPAGYLVVFSGSKIESVADERDRVIWSPS